MKKITLMLLSIVVAIGCALGVAACNSGDIKGKFELSTDGTYYICTGASWYANNGSTDVVDNTFEIPSEYNGKPVKEIAKEAFRASRIGTLIIPNSVTYIGESAFKGAKSTKITFGDYSDATLSTHDDSIQPYSIYIGYMAFSGCDGLKEIEIPANAYLDGYAFSSTSNLEKVTFAGGIAVDTDGEYRFNAFNGGALKSIILPEASKPYDVALSGLTRTSLNYGEEFKDFVLPLKWVVVPENVSFVTNSWETKQIDNYNIIPPTIYYKATSGAPKGANVDAVCKDDRTSSLTRSFSSLIYNYSETSKSGCWHFNSSGEPALW